MLNESILLRFFLFDIFGEWFWQFEWIGCDHKLGFSIEILLILFIFVALLLAFHIIYILMNKQAYYLPNLNSLHMQSKNYQNHQEKLKESRSEYQIYSSCDPTPKEGFVAVKQQLFVKLVPNKHSTSREVHESADGDLLRVNKSYRMELTPLQKRKFSEKTRENQRIYKAMHILSPRIERYDKSREQSQMALKQRISKFVKDGTKMSYKFKKSLIEVEKRKKEKDDYYTQRSNMLREETKAQLQSIIEKSMKVSRSRSKEHIDEGIYTEDINVEHKDSLQKLNILEILSKIKIAKKEELQRVKTQEQPIPKKFSFLKNHRDVVNRKILSYHLQNLKTREKGEQPIRRENLLKKLNSSSGPVDDNASRDIGRPKRVVDMEIIEVTPVHY